MSKKDRAEYFRKYRATSKPRGERDARKEGFAEGVAACIAFLRQFGGDKAFTGNQYAMWIQRKVTGELSAEVQQRNKLVESLGGGSRTE